MHPIVHVYPGSHPATAWISTQLIIVLSAFAVLIFALRRHWLKPWETAVLGAAMIFAAGSWLLQTTFQAASSAYGATPKALWTAVALVFPLALALAVSLAYLVRRMNRLPLPAPKKTSKAPKPKGPATPPPKPPAKRSRRRF